MLVVLARLPARDRPSTESAKPVQYLWEPPSKALSTTRLPPWPSPLSHCPEQDFAILAALHAAARRSRVIDPNAEDHPCRPWTQRRQRS